MPGEAIGPRPILSLNDLASTLRYPKKQLLDVARRHYSFYHPFKKRKPNGAEQDIHNPCEFMKGIQRSIERNILAQIPICAAFYGCVPGRDTIGNASLHVGQEVVVSLDLRRFYPSVSNSQIWRLFRSRMGYSRDVASVLTKLTTYRGQLPHGAPTSAALGNLILDPAVRECVRLVEGVDGGLSQWVDDQAMSGDTRVLRVLTAICKVMSRHGFRIHRSRRKFQIMRHGRRQIVTGLVVNRRVSKPRERRGRVRAAVHNLCKMDPKAPDYDARYWSVRGMVSELKRLHPGEAETHEALIADLSKPLPRKRSAARASSR